MRTLECFDCGRIRVGGLGQKVPFAFPLLLLLKEMRMKGQSKTSSCRFGMNEGN